MTKCAKPKGKVSWWQLSFIGVGCIIGTGYFLGSSIAIQKSGGSVLFAYLMAGVVTWIVFEALAKLTADHPEKGSFRTYAKKAFGPWAGFSNGWLYWSSEMLIMGSQLTALAIFAQFWLPGIPIWMFAAFFAGLGLVVIMMGVQKVEQMENVFGVMKVAAIVMFVVIAGAAALGVLTSGEDSLSLQSPFHELFPNGGIGLWVALIYAFYAFGGVEVMGLMAEELKDPNEAPKSGRVMLIVLSVLYLSSIYLVLKLTDPKNINADESPFLTAFNQYDISWVPHVFNSVLIIAGFSTMVASLYAVTTMLVTLAEEGDAPPVFAKEGKWKVPLPAFGLTTFVVIVSIIIALILPENIFEYMTTSAGLMLLYNWAFILFSYRKLLSQTVGDTVKFFCGLILIALAISGTLFDSISRPGFFTSIGFIFIIASATYMKLKRETT